MLQCMTRTKAVKQYTQRLVVTMTAYVLLVMLSTWLVRHQHVQGWALYVVAVLPSVAILRLLHVVALYLREESDEFIRQQTVVSILWATAATLGVSAFTDFLRSYTSDGTLPPFTIFVAFWIVFGLAQGVQSSMNRVTSDEHNDQ